MNDVKRDFQERCDEINLYFSFLEKVTTKKGKILYPDGASDNIDTILIKTLKAQAFLLLYNLTESSIKKAVEAIFQEILRSGVKYEDAKTHIRKDFIKFIKSKVSADEFVSGVSVLSEDIFPFCLSVKNSPSDIQPQYIKELFSGNVYADTIKNIAKQFGFSSATNPRKTNNGHALKTIKEQRNDLAHGVKSFQEVGQNYSPQELFKMKDETIAYLKQIIDNIESYIVSREFLK